MHIIRDSISLEELKKMAEKMFGQLVKAVVDIEKEIMVIDAEMHADEEELLLEHGSSQAHLWGINIYPFNDNDEDLIEFDSMINLRPSWGNKSRSIDDPIIRKQVITIVTRLIKKC